MASPPAVIGPSMRPPAELAPVCVPVDAGVAGFEPLMRRYNQRLYRLALGLVGDAEEAEDILQESWLRAFQKISTFSGRASIGAWLASIVRHEAIDRLRARRAWRARFTLEADLTDRDGNPLTFCEMTPAEAVHRGPEASLGRDETRTRIEAAIAELPESFRAVFLMREIEGLSVRETAAYLGVPTATVKTRDHRARLLLRQALGAQFDGASAGVFEFLGSRCDAMVRRVVTLVRR